MSVLLISMLNFEFKLFFSMFKFLISSSFSKIKESKFKIFVLNSELFSLSFINSSKIILNFINKFNVLLSIFCLFSNIKNKNNKILYKILLKFLIKIIKFL